MTQLDQSPFHWGEHQIQSKLGVRDQMESFANQVIQTYLPQEHRDFYQQLPYLLVGHTDAQGNPWASILVGQPGFISSKHASQMEISTQPIAGDPLHNAIQVNTELGILGIALSNKRRNRLSGTIKSVHSNHFEIQVKQAFGNCPQFIRTREIEFQTTTLQPQIEKISLLDKHSQQFIQQADTFFVSSYNLKQLTTNHGVDISHKGGEPGFIKIIDEKTLMIPDYSGNRHFNTLGNFLASPRAGLLFIDFESNALLMLTGKVEIIWDGFDASQYPNAERLWAFTLEKGQWIKNGLPITWRKASDTIPVKTTFKEESPTKAVSIHFRKSNLKATWHIGDGSLLEFAEKQGLRPTYGCRRGRCGKCKTTIKTGQVIHTKSTHIKLEDGEMLPCCAEPSTALKPLSYLEIEL